MIPEPSNKPNHWSVLFAVLYPLAFGAWFCWACWELSPWLSCLALVLAVIVADQLVRRCCRAMAFYREIEHARREWESLRKDATGANQGDVRAFLRQRGYRAEGAIGWIVRELEVQAAPRRLPPIHAPGSSAN